MIVGLRSVLKRPSVKAAQQSKKKYCDFCFRSVILIMMSLTASRITFASQFRFSLVFSHPEKKICIKKVADS